MSQQEQVNIRIDKDVLVKLEKERAKLAKQHPGIKFTVADVVRSFIQLGLDGGR